MRKHLFTLALLCLAGCSTSVIVQPHQFAWNTRWGDDTRTGPFAASDSATAQSVTLQSLESIPRADVAQAVVAGVVDGLIKAISLKP